MVDSIDINIRADFDNDMSITGYYLLQNDTILKIFNTEKDLSPERITVGTVNGKKYYGEWSKVLSTKTTISDTTFTIKKADATRATISIKKDKSVTGYIVYMKSGKSYKKVWGSAKTRTYTKTGLTPGKTYRFIVRTYKDTPFGRIYGKKENPKSITM